MQQFFTFVFDHFGVIFYSSILWVLGGFTWLFIRNRKKCLVFPPIESVHVSFHENMVSGRSFKNLWTRRGGANILQVTVTDSEVWIRTLSPLSFINVAFDLEHRIPRSSIIGAEISKTMLGRSVILDFRPDDASVRRIQLRFRDPDAFIVALSLPLRVVKE